MSLTIAGWSFANISDLLIDETIFADLSELLVIALDQALWDVDCPEELRIEILLL